MKRYAVTLSDGQIYQVEATGKVQTTDFPDIQTYIWNNYGGKGSIVAIREMNIPVTKAWDKNNNGLILWLPIIILFLAFWMRRKLRFHPKRSGAALAWVPFLMCGLGIWLGSLISGGWGAVTCGLVSFLLGAYANTCGVPNEEYDMLSERYEDALRRVDARQEKTLPPAQALRPVPADPDAQYRPKP